MFTLLGDRQIRIYHPSPCPLPCYSAAQARERGQLNLPIALAAIFGLAAIVVALFWPIWAWVLLSVPIVIFFLFLVSLKSTTSLRYIEELSPKANSMLRSYWHFYKHPFAGAEISSSLSGLSLAAIVVAVIGLFHYFWWGLLIGIVVYAASSILARQFNPSGFLVDDEEKYAHEEIIAFLRASRE